MSEVVPRGIIKANLEYAVDGVIEATMKAEGVTTGDIAPEQQLIYDECLDKLADIVKALVTQNKH